MKVARNFTLALIAGILVTIAASVVVRVKREQTLFEQDVARDSLVLGRALGHAVERTWQTRGEAEALELMHYAAEQEGHLEIRWVWLEGSGDGPSSQTIRQSAVAALRDGEPAVLPPDDGGSAMYTYIPVRVPNARLGAIEVVDPLVREQAYLHTSVVHASITAAIVVANSLSPEPL